MTFLKRVRAGEIIPKFYGIAWVDYASDGAYCLPVPINVIAAIFRDIWFSMRHGCVEVRLNPRAAYHQGLRDGRKEALGKDWSAK